MDTYEATGIVLSRIHALDPENASKIMGLLLLQDHGDKEMIRLAFGPESVFHSIILKARKELGLVAPFSNPSTPSSLVPPPVFSRSKSASISTADEINSLQAPFLVGDGDSSPANGYHRRSYSAAELCLDSDLCLYYARGFCKNGSSCRFLHCLPEEGEAASATAFGGGGGGGGGKIDDRLAVEQQYHDLFLRSRSQRMGSPSFPLSPMSPPLPISSKSMSFLLQQQQQQHQIESQRAAASLMSSDENYEFMRRSRLQRSMNNADLMNSVSRQIYLTFPADSTFREEDVSNYFSIYGPVQDVRIPYQQKRMFGFVTFVYPETVQLILDKGNPHFVCDCRVLVKPYKEKGKVPDKKLQQQHQFDRIGDFYGLSSPTSLSYRESYELQKLVDARARMLYGNSQEALLRRKLEEQEQAAALQEAIEHEQRRFMDLQLLDLKARNDSSPVPSLQLPNFKNPSSTKITITTPTSSGTEVVSTAEDKCPNPSATVGVTQAGVATVTAAAMTKDHNSSNVAVNTVVSARASGKEEQPVMTNGGLSIEFGDFPESVEHNLPDSPFAAMTNDTFSSVDAVKTSSSPTPSQVEVGN